MQYYIVNNMANMSVAFILSRKTVRQTSNLILRLSGIRSAQMCSSTAESAKEKPLPPQLPEAEQLLHEQIDKLTQENANLSEEALVFKDKYKRTLADRENVRTRLEKQISDAKLFGIQGFCKDLLEVTDVFRKALDSVSQEEINKGDAQLKNLYDGLLMTESHLLSVFRLHGLNQIQPKIGNKFNPAEQEAVLEVAMPDQEPGTVAYIMRPGWNLHQRCIRSAQVGVVKE